MCVPPSTYRRPLPCPPSRTAATDASEGPGRGWLAEEPEASSSTNPSSPATPPCRGPPANRLVLASSHAPLVTSPRLVRRSAGHFASPGPTLRWSLRLAWSDAPLVTSPDRSHSLRLDRSYSDAGHFVSLCGTLPRVTSPRPVALSPTRHLLLAPSHSSAGHVYWLRRTFVPPVAPRLCPTSCIVASCRQRHAVAPAALSWLRPTSRHRRLAPTVLRVRASRAALASPLPTAAARVTSTHDQEPSAGSPHVHGLVFSIGNHS
ncbi:hypothetical protein HD593_009284 [Nonomuraea rubra]|uniref:Uncharacterized protein n=1 Tax=Nonomuraea rubra TaxID=46180 RepID=A0A7X0U4F8_9ACTN|nr:hypothetical protein [Nonomuraea rubra]